MNPWKNVLHLLARKPDATDMRKPVKFIIEQTRARAKKDVDNWRRAINAAERVEMPRRHLLLDIYREVVLDAHLLGELELRKRKCLQSRFSIYTAQNESDEALTWMLRKPWFYDLCSHLLDARFYGHSLVQIDDVVPLSTDGSGGIQSVTLVPREHVVPDTGTLLRNFNDTAGIDYRAEKAFANWIIETPERRNLGLLNSASPYVLYKRFALAAWSEFTELFGSPMRVGKTNMRDTEMVGQMEDMLRTVGSSAYAVIDDTESIEFIETAKSDGMVFEKLIQLCDNQVSKLISGAIIGGAGEGGSRSKEEVGERLADAVVESDKEWLQNIINHRLLPLLLVHGYPLAGCSFAWEEQKDLKELWANTHQSLQYFDVDEDWIRDTFGIQITGKRTDVAMPPPGNINAGFFE